MKPVATSFLAVASFLALIAIVPAPKQAHALGTPEADEFVQKASQSNLFEIESSKLALERSKNTDVRAFAQKMIDDHSGAGAGLKTAAEAAGLSGSVATALDEKHQEILKDLSEEDAADFDDEYVDEQEDAHRKAVKLFKKYSDKGENANLKTFAMQTLPTLEAHKEEVKVLEDKVDAVD